MDLGFTDVKDILEVLIVPVSVGALPWISGQFQKRRFMMLMARELIEMKPRIPAGWNSEDGWHLWLPAANKRFVHEDIFKSPAENREFVLSLKTELAYCATQMWHHLEMARQTSDRGEQVRHGKSWCDYMASVCGELGPGPYASRAREVQRKWQELLHKHYGAAASSDARPDSVESSHGP